MEQKQRITQNDRILKYLKDFGSINPLQALGDLGVMRLASRISELKDRGYLITKRMVESKNRYGETVRYAEYRLVSVRYAEHRLRYAEHRLASD